MGVRLRAFIVTCLGLLGCGADARPQLLVTVDTDAPTYTQALGDDAISRDAAVDTLRIDAFDPDGVTFDARIFPVVDQRDWPISFAVAADVPIKLRFRLWRGTRSDEEELLETSLALPWSGAAIDRLIVVEPSSDGIAEVGVLLSLACMGAPVDFSDDTSCVSADRGRGPADIVDPPRLATIAGSSPLPREQPCSAVADGTVCIPGGFSLLGDTRITGYGAASLDAAPLRPVLVSTFAMDLGEVTVGAFRARWPLPGVDEPFFAEPGTSHELCTWLGAAQGDNDALPLNCITPETADAYCEALGGTLPSEAQWEHAARGRGRGFRFAWGDTAPLCCTASYGRFVPLGSPEPICPGLGPEPPGSHPPDMCLGVGDVSLDGVRDMGGSMNELMRDHILGYDTACWRSVDGVLRDPVCDDDAVAGRALRGGSWAEGASFLLSAARRPAAPNVGSGFRCVYEVAP